jgi:hypothetical protein
MNDDNPTGEVRPMIDREPPNADETQGPGVAKTVLRDLGAGSSPRSLASRGETAHGRSSGAGIRGISAKTFVGPNGTYYDERWRWMEWRCLNRSWNWAAALTFGGWLAYRRFYILAALYLGWLGLLLLLALGGAPLRLVAVLALIVAALVGFYGNTLYQLRFQRMSWKVAEQHEDHAARLKALADAGGVDRRAAWVMALSGGALGALLVTLDG